MLLKKNKEKKINKFKFNLKEHNFNEEEIQKLVNIYSKIRTLSNIFLMNIGMIIISILVIIIFRYIDNSIINEMKTNLFAIFGTLVGIFSLASFVLSIYVYLKIMICIGVLEVKKKVLIWAILSLIPGVSFITFFVMKWKFSHIYKYRKVQ